MNLMKAKPRIIGKIVPRKIAKIIPLWNPGSFRKWSKPIT